MSADAYHVSAHVEARGVDVKIVDYRWKAGELISELDPCHVLRLRSFPSQLGVSAHLRPGALKPFGQLMFFPADVPVQTTKADHGERVRNIMCRFDPSWFHEAAQLPRNWEVEDLARCLDLRNLRIEQAIQRMGAEAADPGFASKLLIEALGTVIAVEVGRHFSERAKTLRVRTFEGKMTPSGIYRMQEYVESITDRNPNIDDIAAACSISSAHLRRSFKKTTGQTVHQYVEGVRLKKAKTLLQETDLPLKEISYRLGFADSSSFSSTFRKSAGESPSGYRYRSRN